MVALMGPIASVAGEVSEDRGSVSHVLSPELVKRLRDLRRLMDPMGECVGAVAVRAPFTGEIITKLPIAGPAELRASAQETWRSRCTS